MSIFRGAGQTSAGAVFESITPENLQIIKNLRNKLAQKNSMAPLSRLFATQYFCMSQNRRTGT